MLSICICIKNRSKVPSPGGPLFLAPNAIKSISKYPHPEEIEIVIADFGSTDWPIKEWIDEYSGLVNTKVVQVPDPFSAGKGRNVAAAHAKGDFLLFLDADVTLLPSEINKGLELLKNGKAVFPLINYIDGRGKEICKGLKGNGSGICFISKELYNTTNKWPEYYSWGGEDCAFLNNVRSAGISTLRPRMPGFKHQWHPRSASHIHYSKNAGTCYTEHVTGKRVNKPTRYRKKPKRDIKNHKVIKKDSIIIVSRFLNRKIDDSFLNEFDAVLRVSRSPTEGYEKIVGSKTSHEFGFKVEKRKYSVVRKRDVEILEDNEYQVPMSFHNKIFKESKIRSISQMTPELLMANWMSYYYKNVHILGHFENIREGCPTTYFGLEYPARKYDIYNELKALAELEEKNKIIIL